MAGRPDRAAVGFLPDSVRHLTGTVSRSVPSATAACIGSSPVGKMYRGIGTADRPVPHTVLHPVAVPVRKLRVIQCCVYGSDVQGVSVSFPCRQATHRFAGFRRFGYIFRIRWQDVPVDEAARVPYGEGVACGRSRRIAGSAEQEDCRKFRQHPSGAFFRRDNSCSNRDRSYRRGGRRGCRIRRKERGCGS